MKSKSKIMKLINELIVKWNIDIENNEIMVIPFGEADIREAELDEEENGK